MSNYNLKLNLMKLPGAKVMDVQGKTQSKRCICIPIDDEMGTICETYTGRGADGQPVRKFFRDSGVYLFTTAFAFEDPKYGHTHFLKASLSSSVLEKMTETDMRNQPILGNMTPWRTPDEKKDDDDLPPADTTHDW